MTVRTSRVINATPFYFGWLILIAGTLGIVMMGPSQTFTVGLFTDSFVNDLGISRSNLSLIYGVATLGASFLIPITGRMVDRYGPRRMIVVISLIFGLSCMGMALSNGVFGVLIGVMALRGFVEEIDADDGDSKDDGSENGPEFASMSVKELRAQCEAWDVDTENMLEKQDLVDALKTKEQERYKLR